MIKPNLPDITVKNVIVSSEITEQIEYSLNNYGITVNKLFGNLNISRPIINHADLYISHFDESTIFSVKGKYKLIDEIDIDDYLYNVSTINSQEILLYPNDSILNCVVLKNNLICNTKTVSKEILNHAKNQNFRIINVRQGYTKCNICVVDENSIITEDFGIYNALTEQGFDVLLLKKHSVLLNGYSYGFIGGASGKISPDKLCFSGNIKLHPEYQDIYKFLYRRGVEAISLSHEPVYDFGSIIPL